MRFLDDIQLTAKNILGSVTKESKQESKDRIVTLLDGTKINANQIPYGEIYINDDGKKVIDDAIISYRLISNGNSEWKIAFTERKRLIAQ